jgi:hypothetical protein
MLERSIDVAALGKASVIISVLANTLSSGPAREAMTIAEHLQKMRHRIVTARSDTAPVLLAELKRLVAALEPLERSGNWPLDSAGIATLNAARAAIAAAEGAKP